ncbi:MAG: oxygen-independent coproporphyrinogen III oxidase [Candidatus Hydrogenedentes bacterium]|nr:oxygen-independent coproporphyrinogen III oxidase [Candidatus Hydrogenedentota bacterium]
MLEVTRELLIRHDIPGPRYTSYPTAPEWGPDFGPEQHRRALGRAADSDAPLSLYVHLPFCASRCLYCGCNTLVPPDRTPVSAYLGGLAREITLVAGLLGNRRGVSQMHWGGGTPNYLSPEEMTGLFGAITAHFYLLPGAELAIEIDPCSVTDPHLETLRGLGFNRVSMGVQDLDPKVQAAVMRNQSVEDTRRVYGKCRDLGFAGVNMDLIYGLPLQETEGWAETLRIVSEMGPDRLAIYGFAYLPGRLEHQKGLEGLPMPAGPEKYALFAQARNHFLGAGYQPIGMDHFARPGDELSRAMRAGKLGRNFMGYTVAAAPDQLGFGVSAISEAGDAYAQNHKTLEAYHAALAADTLPTALGIALSPDDLLRRWIIRELMCNFRLDFSEVERRFGVVFGEAFASERRDLEDLAGEGFLTLDADGITILPLGAVFVRNICMVFDAYLKRTDRPHGFSRTV